MPITLYDTRKLSNVVNFVSNKLNKFIHGAIITLNAEVMITLKDIHKII